MDRKLMMLSMLKRICSPGETVSGPDSLRRLQTLFDGNALLIASQSSQLNGIQEKASEFLTKGGNNLTLYTAPSGEPTVSIASAIAKQMIKINPQWVIALGGGSVLDAVKVAWACYEHPELDFTQTLQITVPPLRQKAKFIAIPTTAGSGSESSQVAVLKSEDCGTPRPYLSMEWIPDLVILDPKLTISLTPVLTAQTGMDALTHAIEAYVSRLSSRLVKTMAATATRLILKNLPLAYNSPDDLQAREAMLNGAYLAGICQSAASTGLAHALTHASSAVADATHANANALFLYPTMSFNRDKNLTLYASLAVESGFDPSQFFESVEQLTNQISLPRKLSDIAQSAVDATVIQRIAEKALSDVCMRTNPNKPTQKELITLLGALQ